MSDAAGLVLLLHGGRAVSSEPVTGRQLAVLRMALLAGPVRRAVRGRGVKVRRPLFTVRGWNGELASPVADVTRWLDQAAEQWGPVPVVLIGHSMGGRAALRAAGHPSVVGVAGLAPWLSDAEPVRQLAGRAVLLVHGDRDRVTSASATWQYADRARAVTEVTTVPVPGGDHAMLRHERRWHQLAAGFAAGLLPA